MQKKKEFKNYIKNYLFGSFFTAQQPKAAN